MMPESLMDDNQGEAGPSRPNDGDEPKEEQGGATALVNKELFPDAQPGDRLIIEVDKVMGEEIQVRFVSKEGEGDGDGDKGDAPAPESEAPAGESLMD